MTAADPCPLDRQEIEAVSGGIDFIPLGPYPTPTPTVCRLYEPCEVADWF